MSGSLGHGSNGIYWRDIFFRSVRHLDAVQHRPPLKVSVRTKPGLSPEHPPAEDPPFLQHQLVTYLGNKRSLLPFIGQAIATVKTKLHKSKLSFLDLFSGSGVVSRYMKQHAEHIIANDLETYSRIISECYLTNRSSIDVGELEAIAASLEDQVMSSLRPGVISELYAPRDETKIAPDDRVFYTRQNAMILDTARVAIGQLPQHQQKFFLAPLLSEASVHVNTSGVFKGFYKARNGLGQFGGSKRNALTRILGSISINAPILSRFDCSSDVTQEDANSLVCQLDEVDLAYIDPPYNQHPYGSNYFMLNLLCDYQQPSNISRVSGIPSDWNRSNYNNRLQASRALTRVIDQCKARFVLISYNSEGFVPYEEFYGRLCGVGKVTVLETQYNTFRGSRNLRQRSRHVKEYLYLLEK